MRESSESQLYLSTRGGSYGLSFEDVVLKGLASDGGLFIPQEIPSLPIDWVSKWRHLSFADLALEILSLYISDAEMPTTDLKDIITRSYSKFRSPEITPLVTLDSDKNLHILELFHGPTFAFKDVALQLLGNLFEYFLVRRNEGLKGDERHHLTVIGATSGDTGSAAIYGLTGKKDISIFMLHPEGKVSPVQEAQMTTVLDSNVHNLAVQGTFDDCQDIVKALFSDPIINKTQKLAAVNSINWARILAQITYFFYGYLTLLKSPHFTPSDKVKFVVPTGNFGDVLAGYFAKRMGLPVEKLVVATNENDILDRFWKSGYYEKKPIHGLEALGGLKADGAQAHVDGVKETLSPAMDILVSSNFERLLWFLSYSSLAEGNVSTRRRFAGEKVTEYLNSLKTNGGFGVKASDLETARTDFESQRVTDAQTVQTIKDTYLAVKAKPLGSSSTLTNGSSSSSGYILDPHSAIGIFASLDSISKGVSSTSTHYVSLATAHPAKFRNAVDLALQSEVGFDFDAVLPKEFVGLEQKKRRKRQIPGDAGWQGVRTVILEELASESVG
ncbi:MAG: threonine synthase [Vezdaea aestivalis]|nr:MAG: threonine synthase [Vezdaea aestivalis]